VSKFLEPQIPEITSAWESKNIEEIFSVNPDETARVVGMSDETRTKHLSSAS